MKYIMPYYFHDSHDNKLLLNEGQLEESLITKITEKGAAKAYVHLKTSIETHHNHII